jgi:hypothetical protein
MKKFHIVLSLVLALMLFSCSTFQSVNATDLAARFEASANNTAVSWWYLGETQYYYLLAEKRPGKVTTFRVGKEKVKLNGIDPFMPGMKESVRLKRENIRFDE